jgi:hypothetical protein
MANKRTIIVIFTLLILGCAGQQVGTLILPDRLADLVVLTNRKCPEQPPDGAQYFTFKIDNDEKGCYANFPSQQKYKLIIASSKSTTGKPIFLEFSYAQLNKAKQDSDTLMLQVINGMSRSNNSNYSGNCPCPYSIAADGSTCGARSAYSRSGGASPRCY